ncbi:MAG: hypothetical protein NZ740_05625 [Kiritimatiellae bacterium]|nr:hypothetical protein [Kiritimatiellia bacterium]MDW8458573.1 hypothetical protein [Verrucomicrobiota bacterium]
MCFFRVLLPLLFCVVPLTALSEDAGASIATEQLRQELEQIRSEIEATERGMNQKMAEIRERRHQIEFGDPEIAALRQELVELERQVLRKREELEARIAANKALKALEDERRAVFQKLKELRETEAAIRRELAARENS